MEEPEKKSRSKDFSSVGFMPGQLYAMAYLTTNWCVQAHSHSWTARKNKQKTELALEHCLRERKSQKSFFLSRTSSNILLLGLREVYKKTFNFIWIFQVSYFKDLSRLQ